MIIDRVIIIIIIDTIFEISEWMIEWNSTVTEMSQNNWKIADNLWLLFNKG